MALRAADTSRASYCPFCGEKFQGLQCPVHELELVTLEQLRLARQTDVIASDIPRLLWRYPLARSLFWLGALGWMAGFWLRFVTIDLQRPLAFTGLHLALTRAYNLWSVPLAATVVSAILVRRRNIVTLLPARIALIFSAVMPLIAMGYTWFGIQRWVRLHVPSATIHLGLGAYVIGLCSVSILLGVMLLSRRER